MKTVSKPTSRKFKIGDVVYFVDWKHNLKWGICFDIFSDGICLQMYGTRDYRLIDGIPVQNFDFNHPRKKLPNGWSYSYELFHITYDEYWQKLYITEFAAKKDWGWLPEQIKHLIEIGLFVPQETLTISSHIESDITKEGWTILEKHYYCDEYKPNYVTLFPDECFSTVEKAAEVIKKYCDELIRQQSLTDEEWVMENVDKVLGICSCYTDEEKAQVRKFISSLKNLKDVEVQCVGGHLEFKYERSKKWMSADR